MRPRPKATRPRPVQWIQLHVKVTQIGMLYFRFGVKYFERRNISAHHHCDNAFMDTAGRVR